MVKSILKKILSKVLGFVVFLVIIIILNLLAPFIQDPYFYTTVLFMNANIGLFILMTLFFFLADIFSGLEFPLNLPTPIFNSVGAILVVSFIIRVFGLVGQLTGNALVIDLGPIAFLIYLIVFTIVFFIGYISIILRTLSSDRQDPADGPEELPTHKRLRRARRRR
jgi:hypothetical protein